MVADDVQWGAGNDLKGDSKYSSRRKEYPVEDRKSFWGVAYVKGNVLKCQDMFWWGTGNVLGRGLKCFGTGNVLSGDRQCSSKGNVLMGGSQSSSRKKEYPVEDRKSV